MIGLIGKIVPNWTTNLHWKLLNYLVNKTLHPLFDIEDNLLDYADGRFTLTSLQLKPAAIQPHLAGLPLTFVSGTLGTLHLAISQPLALSSTLAVSLKQLSLVLRISTASDEDSDEPPDPTDDPLETSIGDLAASAVSLLDDDDDLSSLPSFTAPLGVIPGAFGENSEAALRRLAADGEEPVEEEKVTLMAGMIEALISRLKVQVDSVKVRLELGTADESYVELEIAEVEYKDETTPMAQQDGNTVRVVRISPPKVKLYTTRKSEPVSTMASSTPLRPSGHRRTSSSSEDTTSSEGDSSYEARMRMSQSVVGLGQSMYASARTGMGSVLEGSDDSDGDGDPFSAAPLDEDEPAGAALGFCNVRVLDFGSRSTTVTLRKTVANETRQPRRLDVLLAVPEIKVLVLASQLSPIAEVLQGIMGDTSSPRNEAATEEQSGREMGLELTVGLVDLRIVYSLLSQPAELEAAEMYWGTEGESLKERPLHASHLQARLNDLKFTSGGGISTAEVRDLGVWEHVSVLDGWRRLPLLVVLRDEVSEPSSSRHNRSRSRSGTPQGMMQGPGTPSAGPREDPLLPTLGAFEMRDWLVTKERAPVKKRARIAGLGIGEREEDRNMAAALTWKKGGGHAATVEVLPVQLFLDLTIYGRLAPFLKALPSFAPSTFSVTRDLPDSRGSTPRSRTPRSRVGGFTDLRVLDDLGFETNSPPAHETKLKGNCTVVTVQLVRVVLRSPPPASYVRDRERDGAVDPRVDGWFPVRSGIAVLDLRQLSLVLPDSTAATDTIHLTLEELALSFAPAGSSMAIGVLKVTKPIEEAELSGSHALVVFFRTSPPAKGMAESLVNPPPETAMDLRLLRSRVVVDKAVLEGLQLFVDDLTQWSANLENLAMSRTSEDLDALIVGSRFFSAKSFVKVHKKDDSESSDGGTAHGDGRVADAMSIKVGLEDVQIHLLASRKPAQEGAEGGVRVMRVSLSELLLQLRIKKNGTTDNSVALSLMDIVVEDASAEVPKELVKRTTRRNLAVGSASVFELAMTTSVEKETGLKESKVVVRINNLTYFLEPDLSWIGDIVATIKTPAGAFEGVVPNELTRIRASLTDCAVHYTPPVAVASRIVLTMGRVDLSTDLVPISPRTTYSATLRDILVLVLDSADDLRPPDVAITSGAEFYRTQGFVKLVDLAAASLQYKQGNGHVLPDGEVILDNGDLLVSLCADSLGVLLATVSSFPTSAPPVASADSVHARPAVAAPVPPLEPAAPPTRDVFASVDDETFRQAARYPDLPELVHNRDVPSNENYISANIAGAGKKKSKVKPSDRYRLREEASATATSDEGIVTSDIDGEKIRIFHPDGLQLRLDHFANPRPDALLGSEPVSASKIRVRLNGLDVKVHLHEGYDWPRTRRTIEEQAKAVRRRLEKIRQLLASGQTPDATAEEASVLMYGSVQLGLPEGANLLPPHQLLAAVDEELNTFVDYTDDTASVASDTSAWEPVQGTRGGRKTSAARKRSRKLTRSKALAIEVKLDNINAQFDAYPSRHELSAKTQVRIQHIEIIDNIKTSTWKKFLSELRPSDGGLVRTSESNMLRLEVVQVRPKLKKDQDEIVMKLKIAPIRLYVDQDALDFLKAFGAFNDETLVQPSASASETAPSPEAFFQRVEIFPIKLKLDYKPKRVDMQALRKGKTIELMNFFHFDGSEMTLRHLVLTGVSGGARLGELVQDIWTPDVKANQLVEVISGIAPVRSVVNVGSGIANLVLLPIEQYRKDGRIIRGLQKGASSFAKNTALEALRVGAQLATGTQVVLEQAEGVLGARFTEPTTVEAVAAPATDGTVEQSDSEDDPDLISRYAAQPGDLREGIESAYKSLGTNFRSAAQTILAVPMEVYERSGSEGSVRAVVRAVPVAVLKPMIGATEAMSKAFLGLRNTLDPDAQAEIEDKYKQLRTPGPSSPT